MHAAPGVMTFTKPSTPSYTRRDTFEHIYPRDRLEHITSKGGPGFAPQRVRLPAVELGIFGIETLDENILVPRKMTPAAVRKTYLI